MNGCLESLSGIDAPCVLELFYIGSSDRRTMSYDPKMAR